MNITHRLGRMLSLVLACILLAGAAGTARAQEGAARTANPNASPAAKKVLDYLIGLSNKTGSQDRLIVGQFGAYGDGTTAETARAILRKVYDQSGKWPALTGVDYRNWDLNNANNFKTVNDFLIEQWREGALVTVSWHASNPWTGKGSNDWEREPGSGRPRNVREVYTPDTMVNAVYMAMLDNIAFGLQQLEDAGVVVLWRPFHEMNGGWFWWHLQSRGEYIALWQHMFNYFTNVKGLDNLLWVYAPNVRGGRENRPAEFFYPGNAFVDIVGLDKYLGEDETELNLNRLGEYRGLTRLGKPFALTEFGPSPASSQPDRPKYDYAKLVEDIADNYPDTVFFLAWEWHWAIGEHDGAKDLMNDPWVITRDEMPKFE
jgi:mannan endo-1,4-beta-mannosidase